MSQPISQAESVQESLQILSLVDFPEVPKGVLWLEESIREKDVNFFDIVKELEKHPGLVEEIIKTANHVLLNMNHPVSTISQAINFLGAESLYHLVISSHFRCLFAKNEAYEIVLEHSSWTAKAMVLIERKSGDQEPDFAYTLGLFHNLGAMVLSLYDPKKYLEFFQKSRAFPVSALQKEEIRYGTNHCMLGVIIGKKWKISRQMLEVIYRHHDLKLGRNTDKTTRKWIARLFIANVLVDQVCYKVYQTTEIKLAFEAALAELNLSEDTFQAFKGYFVKSYLS